MQRIKRKVDEPTREKLYALAMQFIKFSLVGLTNTAVSFLVYFLVLEIDKNLYILGNIAGWVVGVTNSFFFNNRVVFREEKAMRYHWVRKLVRTYLVYGLTLVISSALLYLEVKVSGWNTVIAPMVNLLVTVPLNFVLSKFWAFRA